MKCQLVNKPINSNYLEELLRERGVKDLQDFLNPTEDLIQSPDYLDNIAEGWELLEKIILDGKKILLVVD